MNENKLPKLAAAGLLAEVKKRLGVAVITLLALAPVFLWWVFHEADEPFNSFSRAMSSLGQVSGLVGLALLALALILSARFGFYRSLFGGLNKEYSVHHTVGVLGFVFILAHPLSLALRFVPGSLWAAASFLLPGTELDINLGILSLVLFIFIITATLFAHWRYQVLKFTHKMFGFAFLFGVIHMFLVGSDVAAYKPLAVYMYSLAGLALAAFVYRSLLGRWLVRKYSYQIVEVKRLNGDTTEIELKSLGKSMAYRPGQYVFVNIYAPGLGAEAHPFSITSGANEKNLRLMIKGLGDYTKKISALVPGVLVKVEGPFGNFFYEGIGAKTQKMIWIAGGIGVTPFVSMVRSLEADSPLDYGVDFYYCVKDEGELVCLDECRDVERVRPDFKIIPVISARDGRLTASRVAEISQGLENKDVFICGPESMMQSLRSQFRELGASPFRIHLENFKML